MNETLMLDELVPRFDTEPGDWDDVLRRARGRRPPGRMLLAVAIAVAVFGVAPALAVVLLRDQSVRLPAAADRSNVAVILEPRSGRILLQIAPWKGRAGFCYALLGARAGCVPHKARGTVASWPPLFGWSFDPRVHSGTETTRLGKRVPLIVAHFGGKVDVTVFLRRRIAPPLPKEITLRDADGAVVVHLRLGR